MKFYLKRIGLALALLIAAPVSASSWAGTIDTGSGVGTGIGGTVITVPTASPSANTYTSTQSVQLAATGSSSICYTTSGTDPVCSSATTCSTGATYASAISVSSTETIKARSCYPNSNSSSVASFTYTISVSSGGGGGGGGGGTTHPTCTVANWTCGEWSACSGNVQTRLCTNTINCLSSTAPTTSQSCSGTGQTGSGSTSGTPSAFTDPSDNATLVTNSGKPRDTAGEATSRALANSDGKAFGVALSSAMLDAAANYITYGIDNATHALGSGERRAVLRDYLQITGFATIRWDDIVRISNGTKPVYRNLKSEQAQVTVALGIFKKIFGHSPVFTNPVEDLSWNTIMYRIRFPRDFVKEAAGIKKFKTIFGRNPSTPLNWSTVRILGYVKV